MVVGSTPIAPDCGADLTMTQDDSETVDEKRDSYTVAMVLTVDIDTHSKLSARSKSKGLARKLFELDSVTQVNIEEMEVQD